jgi:hypothetical protein
MYSNRSLEFVKQPVKDKVYQLLAHGRWFSSGTPASSTTKTGRHDIAEILLKVVLNTNNQSIAVTSIKQSPVLKGHLFLVLSYIISYELSLF